MVQSDDNGITVLDDIPWSKVQAVDTRLTVRIFNSFTVVLVHNLRKFWHSSNEKLNSLDYRINRLDAELRILEAKLASIPGVAVESSAPSTRVGEETVSQTSAPPVSNGEVRGPVGNESSVTVQETPRIPVSAAENIPPPDSHAETVTQDRGLPEIDPAVARFLKMLKMGVPTAAVKLKMSSEGFDPAIIDSPQLLAGHYTVRKEESEEDDSSEED